MCLCREVVKGESFFRGEWSVSLFASRFFFFQKNRKGVCFFLSKNRMEGVFFFQ